MEVKFEIKTVEKQGKLNFKLVLLTEDNELTIYEHDDLDVFKKYLDQLNNLLTELKLTSDKLYKKFQEQKKEKEAEDIPMLWKKMEDMDEETFISFFNSLDDEIRKQVADYVFSKVNMFKGKGILFANFFNHSNYLLEK